MRLILFAVFSVFFPLASIAAEAPLHLGHHRPPADTGDLYGVTVPTADSAVAKPAAAVKTKDSAAALPVAVSPRTDSTFKTAPDTTAKKIAADTALKAHRDTAMVKTLAPTDTSARAKTAADTAEARKPRQHLVRETTINPMNEHKGHYRSPKKALFMSLVIPGLGQAYVGQSALNYVRAGIYLGIDVALGVFWYHYVVVRQDAEVAKYRSFADTAWSQNKYEDSISSHSSDQNTFGLQNPFRNTYCEAVQSAAGGGNALLQGCEEPYDPTQANNYQAFHDVIAGHDYGNVTPASAQADSIHNWRAGFPDSYSFYELIGKEQEFISGWNDAANVVYGDSSILGTSALRDQYLGMRSTANRYARMQAWFFGGIVINHIVSALDAALTARYNNMSLYETETSWYDRIHLNSDLSFDGPWPCTSVVAAFSF